MALKTHGTMAVDWEQRIDFDRLRRERLAKAKALLAKSEMGALLCFDMNNVRYITATHIGTWAQDKISRFCLLPQNGEPILWDFGSAAKVHRLHAPWLRERAGDYGVQVRNRLQNGLAYSAVEYLEALRWRGPALAAHLEAIDGIDVVIAPASSAAAPTIDETDVGGGPGAEVAIQAITRFMRPINYLGLPVLEIPAGQSRHGTPIGLQPPASPIVGT